MVIQYEATVEIDICKEFLRKQEKYLWYNVKKNVQRDTKLHSEFQLYKINEHSRVCPIFRKKDKKGNIPN